MSIFDSEDPYEILQVSHNAEHEVIVAAYKQLAKKYHPDMNSSISSDKMAQINWAFEILSDPIKLAAWKKAKVTSSEPDNTNSDKYSSSPVPNSSTESKNQTHSRTQTSTQNNSNSSKSKEDTNNHHNSTSKNNSNNRFTRKFYIFLIVMALSLISKLSEFSASTSGPQSQNNPTRIAPSQQHPTSVTKKKPTSTPNIYKISAPYFEDFSTKSNLWPTNETSYAYYEIKDGKYVITPKNNGEISSIQLDGDFKNIILEFTTYFQYSLPKEDAGFVVSFRCNGTKDENCYEMYVSDQGFALGLRTWGDMDNASLVFDKIYSQSITPFNHPNKWTITMKNEKFDIYCNGTFIASFSDMTYGVGSIKFGVFSPSEGPINGVAFDDIKIYENK